MSSVSNPSDSKPSASKEEVVVTTEDEKRRLASSLNAPEGKQRDAGKKPIQEIEMIPASQMSRRPRTSRALQQGLSQPSKLKPPQPQPPAPQPHLLQPPAFQPHLLQPPKPFARPQPPLPGQVMLTQPGRIQKQKIPPPVPVRKRKPTSTVADTTLDSSANTSALHSTVNTPPAPIPQDKQSKTPVIPAPDNAKPQTSDEIKLIAKPLPAETSSIAEPTTAKIQPIAEPVTARAQPIADLTAAKPTTAKPTTAKPTTATPTTATSTTATPTTAKPTTATPTTATSTTATPTTAKPTTATPTTATPTTATPTTATPTTATPTTATPTTAKPDNAEPQPTAEPTTTKPTTAKPINAKAQDNEQDTPIADPDNAKKETQANGDPKPASESYNAKREAQGDGQPKPASETYNGKREVQGDGEPKPSPEPYNAKREVQGDGEPKPSPEPYNGKREAQRDGQPKPSPEPYNGKREVQGDGKPKPSPEPYNAKREAKGDEKTKTVPEPTVILQIISEISPVSTKKSTPPVEKPDEKLDETQKASKEASPTNPTPPEYKEETIAEVTPQTVAPPPVRPRRASSYAPRSESLLDPKDTLLIQRRSSSPQSYSGHVDKEFLKSYFPTSKTAETPQAQSQPSSLTASQKTLIRNASQKSLSSNASQKSLGSNASQKSGNSTASKKSADSNASKKSEKPNASQKTSNKTSTDSLANTKDDDKHTPIMAQSIVIKPTSSGKLKRQSSLTDEISKKKNSQIKANDTDVTSAWAIGGKVYKIQKPRLTQSATDLIEPAPAPNKKKGHKERADHSGRKDSMVSSDSVSVTSSSSYTTKIIDASLLPNKPRKIRNAISLSTPNVSSPTPITKSASTPAGFQTWVRISGSNSTIQHSIVRPPSNRFTRFFNIRYLQFIVNILILVGLGIVAFIYFKPPEPVIKYVNKTITNTIGLIPPEKNPAPGYCVKVVVDQCVNKVPYNYTRFPSLFHVNQDGAKQELDMYDAIVDVRCYELAALFLCSVFVPKCGLQGELLYPCRSLCEETKRRCGFFLNVFGLPPLPDYLMECRLLPDSDNPDVCVGHREVQEAKLRAARPKCIKKGFQCDTTRCIPKDWKCDGHMDCLDKSDEKNCNGKCANGTIYCGKDRCMDKKLICDGIIDCPYGQDERNCIRLHDKMGDVGRGLLQVYDPKFEDWIPACVSRWDNANSASAICSMLGYNRANYTRLIIKDTNVEVQAPTTVNISDYQTSNWVQDFRNCGLHHYPIVNMECQEFECGRKRNPIAFHTKRIVGGSQSKPGSWPFLAAIHGGPEEIFYCAGVLISDEWVLTASHCVGNASEENLDGWKIQLGVTRRYSHSFYGQKASVKRVIAHPEYNMGINHDNDIALFQLERPVTFTEHVLPVCLPPPELKLRPGMRCTVIGWGKSEDDECSEYEPALHEVEVPLISRRLCNEWMIYRELNVTDGMICAGLAEGGKDACQGDSGGPLLCPYDRYKKRWFVGGIVSWGIKCAHPQLPGVYAYVPKFVPWINEMMNKYSTE